MTEETGWTEERLKMLKALWDEGLSISQIGQRLNVTRNAVAGKAHRLSLPKRQSPISSTAAPVRAKVKKTEEIADELPFQYGPIRSKMVQNGPKWSKMVQNYPK